MLIKLRNFRQTGLYSGTVFFFFSATPLLETLSDCKRRMYGFEMHITPVSISRFYDVKTSFCSVEW